LRSTTTCRESTKTAAGAFCVYWRQRFRLKRAFFFPRIHLEASERQKGWIGGKKVDGACFFTIFVKILSAYVLRLQETGNIVGPCA
ncbi:MAG: hypothetical protein IKX05_00675, partial [Bacteroidales bacterium]|nr:hypothetical protein [Bacteroidales bacterium]